MSKLFRVFCNDNGGQDIKDAFDIATSLDNDILLAQVYRYSEFMPNYSLADKEELYDKGYNIFKKNSMNDLAIYCQILFDVINERTANNKKIIINTNLQISEITKMYSMRFTSRLYEYFMMYKFYGEDIRIQKLRRS